MKAGNLIDIIEQSRARRASREERDLNNGRTGKGGFGVEKLRVFTDPGWDVSFWFAVLSPVFGILAGFLAAFLIYH